MRVQGGPSCRASHRARVSLASPSSPASCSRLIHSARRCSGCSCDAGAVFGISISHRDPGEGRGRGEGSRHKVPEPRRRPELKRRIQFRSLFHWDFRIVSGIQRGLSPSALPPFPVPMARNLRLAGVAVDVCQLWASTSSEWQTQYDGDHVPALCQPTAQLSGRRLLQRNARCLGSGPTKSLAGLEFH